LAVFTGGKETIGSGAEPLFAMLDGTLAGERPRGEKRDTTTGDSPKN
jgi:hypothetical protein